MEPVSSLEKPISPSVSLSGNSVYYSRLQAQLDDIKSALYSVAEKVGKSSANFDQINSELVKTNNSLKSEIQKLDDANITQQAFATLVSDTVERKLEDSLKSYFSKVSNPNSSNYLQLPIPPGSPSNEITPQTIELISKSLSNDLDKKLKLLAEIDSEMLKKINDNYSMLEAIKSNSFSTVIRNSAFSNYPNPPEEQLVSSFQPKSVQTTNPTNLVDTTKLSESLNTLISKFESDSEFKSKIEVELSKQKDLISSQFNSQNQQIVTLFNKALESVDETIQSSGRDSNSLTGSIQELIQKQSEQADVFSSTLLKILEYVENIQKRINEQKVSSTQLSSTQSNDLVQSNSVLSQIASNQQEQYQALSKALLLLDSSVKQFSLQTISNSSVSSPVSDVSNADKKELEKILSSLDSMQKSFDEKLQSIPSSLDKSIDDKLASLAKLDVQMLAQITSANQYATETSKAVQTQLNQKELMADSVAYVSTEVKELTSALKDQTLTLQNSLESIKTEFNSSQSALIESIKSSNKPDASITEFENNSLQKFELFQNTLSKIVDNQNKQNQVFSDALSGILDATDSINEQILEVNSKIKSFDESLAVVKVKVESFPSSESEITKHVEQEIAKKLG